MIANLALVLLAATPPAAAPRILTLDEALAAARTLQPQVRQAAAATEAALARTDAAMAPLIPQVSGSGNYSRETANYASRPGSLPGGIGGGGSSSSWATSSYYNFGLGASVLLYDFGQTRSR